MIAAAVAACTAGQFVLLASGTFELDMSESVNVNKAITVRGSGTCNSGSSPRCPTLVTYRNGALATYAGGGNCGVNTSSIVACSFPNSAFYLAPTGTYDFGWDSCGHGNPCNSGVALATDAAQGAVTIQVMQTSSFSVGNWVLIDEASGAEWQTDPISSLGQTWAASDFQTATSGPATGRIVWGLHNPAFAIDNFASPQYPYNTPGGISCGYGINCDRGTGEMHLISSIGAGPCPGINCTLTFDSPLTIAFREGGGAQMLGYISSGSGSSSPGSTLTITSLVSGTVAVDQPLWWAGMTGPEAISYVTSGSGTSWTTSNLQQGGTGNASISVGSPGSPVAISAAAHNAQVYLPSHQSGGAVPVLQEAGVENLSISRSGAGGVNFQFCVYCWVKNVEVFNWIAGGINLQDSARVQVDTVYLHDCVDCENNGSEYALSLNAAVTESLVTNSIITNSGKSMVGRANGGGNVISYNYFDDTFYQASVIGNYFIDHSANCSHYLGAHHCLFEGNYAETCGDDNTHGAIMYNTWYRNWCVGLRAPFNDPSFTVTTSVTYNPTDAPEDDQTQVCFAQGNAYPYTGGCGPVRAVSVMAWDYWEAFSGNVLGKSGVTTAGNGYVYNGSYTANNFMITMWGWNNVGPSVSDPNLNGTNTPRWIWIDGNYDYLNDAVTWAGSAHSLPNSLYLLSAPPSFGPGVSCTYTWPQVTPTSSPQIQPNSCGGAGLPAQARWNAGTPFVQP